MNIHRFLLLSIGDVMTLLTSKKICLGIHIVIIMCSRSIYEFALCILSLKLSMDDIHAQEVRSLDLYIYTLFMIGLRTIPISYHSIIYLIFTILFHIIFVWILKAMGSADTYLLVSIALSFGNLYPYILLCSTCFALLTFGFKKEKHTSLPFIPYLSITSLLFYFMIRI